MLQTARAFLRAAWVATVVIGVAQAQSVPDRVSNVEKASAEIAAIQAKNGADGAFAAINECYKREVARATTSLTRELEACMAQDIIISKVSAAFYAQLSARLPPEARKKGGSPDPEVIMKAMTQRVLGTFSRFKVREPEATAFGQIVETKGMEAYGRARFPGQYPAKKD
jgi:hypothetical protein